MAEPGGGGWGGRVLRFYAVVWLVVIAVGSVVVGVIELTNNDDARKDPPSGSLDCDPNRDCPDYPYLTPGPEIDPNGIPIP